MPADDLFDACLDEAAHVAAGHDAGLRQARKSNCGHCLAAARPPRPAVCLTRAATCFRMRVSASAGNKATRKATRWARRLALT